jgi:biotin transport system substrate-specific component
MSQVQGQTQTAVSNVFPSWLPASRAMRSILSVFLGSAMLALCAHISIPFFFTPVPFTLQPLAVLLLALLLEPTVAFATLVAYLVEGACGLPVFAPTADVSIFHLMGPSAGFLWAYPFAALLVSKLYRSFRPASFTSAALSATAGAVIYFICGASWLAVFTHQPMSIALKLAVWPFVAGDALKIMLAAVIVTGFSRFRNRQSTESAA